MFIIPIKELHEIVNDHFGNGDAQTQSTNDEAELQEQPRADDVDKKERENPPDWENESSSLFLTHCRYVDIGFIEMLLDWSSTERMHLVQNANFETCITIYKSGNGKT